MLNKIGLNRAEIKFANSKKNVRYSSRVHSLPHRYDHQQMHEKHRGHESMHLEMMLVLVATLVIAQLLLVHWKKRHYRSYSVTNNILGSNQPHTRY